MSLFQNWVIFGDYFGDKLPLPKIMEQKKEKKNADSTDTETAGKIIKDGSKNRALTITPSFDGLFYFEAVGQKEEEKKKVDFKDTTTAKTLDIGAGIDNVVAGESKKNSSKNRALAIDPAFDGLFPFEMFVSRDHASS